MALRPIHPLVGRAVNYVLNTQASDILVGSFFIAGGYAVALLVVNTP